MHPVTFVHPDPSLHRSKLRELHKAARETEDPELQVRRAGFVQVQCAGCVTAGVTAWQLCWAGAACRGIHSTCFTAALLVQHDWVLPEHTTITTEG